MPMPQVKVAPPQFQTPQLQMQGPQASVQPPQMQAPQAQMPQIQMQAPQVPAPQAKPPDKTNVLLIVIFCLVAFLIGAVLMLVLIKPK